MSPIPCVVSGPILLAAGIDWLEAILPVVFVGFWILSQVFAVVRRMGGGPRPPVVRMPDAQAPGQPRPAPQPGIDPRAELERQIAEFLRQATGGARPVEPPKATPKPPERSRGTAASRPRGRTTPEAAEAGRPVRPPSTQAAARPRPGAERQVGTLEAGPSAVARHVQDAFAHKLGHLHSRLESAAHEAETSDRPKLSGRVTAQELVRTARDPATIRQAILLRAVLERPVDRWEP